MTAIPLRAPLTEGDPRPSARIVHADAMTLLRSLPDASVDLITTDPAYNGMNQHLALGTGRIVGDYAGRGDGERWFDEFDDSPEAYAAFLLECRRVLRDDRHVFLMFDPYSMLTLGSVVREHLALKNVVTWDKVNIGMGHNFRRQTEFILFASKGRRRLARRDIPDVWRIKRVHRAAYPTQKPVELFEAMIASSVHDADERAAFTVLDPFVGSGASALAALRQGCSFVGGDVADAAIDAARSRIAAFEAGEPDPLQATSSIVAGTKVFW